jgi:SHAQKYF class myb-like DNA-binding protein
MKNEPEHDEKIGRWTQKEHKRFVEGLRNFGKNWKKISSLIKTRNCIQVRSHAQKYFIKKTMQNDGTKMQFCDKISLKNINTRKIEASTQYGEGMIFPIY